MIDLKLCGLRTEADIDAAVGAGATHIGLVRFPPSPRHLRLVDAARLARHAESSCRVVVVTVNADDGEIDQIAEEVRPDLIQLHGKETPERATTIRERTGIATIKALAVRDPADLEKADAYRGTVNALLFDAKAPEGSTLPGGNGVSFDWTMLRDYDPAMPWFLAGGLTADNLVDAVRQSGARALDLSSGIEDAPGEKSASRIAAVGEAVQALGAALSRVA